MNSLPTSWTRRSLGEAMPNAALVGGLGIAVGLLEGYALYKIWTTHSGSKDWPWYVLGAAVGLNVLLKLGLGVAANTSNT